MRKVNFKIASTLLALGLVGGLATSAAAGVPSVAQNDAAKVEAPLSEVGWYCCHHHHYHHWHHHYITRLVPAGTVSYPVYRVEHYTVDYSAPIYAYAPVVTTWWFW